MKRYKVYIKMGSLWSTEVDANDINEAMMIAEDNFDEMLYDFEEGDIKAVDAEEVLEDE